MLSQLLLPARNMGTLWVNFRIGEVTLYFSDRIVLIFCLISKLKSRIDYLCFVFSFILLYLLLFGLYIPFLWYIGSGLLTLFHRSVLYFITKQSTEQNQHEYQNGSTDVHLFIFDLHMSGLKSW